ncbi:aryl-alcohol dehydrogenase-like predicted oxidoreductase [Thermosporothrix hazakensis]|jgi:aryl-alcohol dehydrogenase-like predicted oxidoreductase|uniref:Aryl-alcohol dehydrogenase-like predicted oxidoreductase n=2 Tax=Thermosporothrix TaxID=768650 RepID=A0A326UG50_THEHA|nr:aldo/keto reductase [Thermosporothrix hazakensis]PZW26340.1 aryl-alcohol dehydrogenase-like predicted oxidoreductase [Thermosporothrix hazakensis]BBH90658.1 oxidoreductase [Thermosporothrix sp. COM3]GCE48709.1 oxidoreductase [Thermosporothrix hazakensis]
MQTREFGKTGMQITPIGLGAWAMGGGGWAFGWGPQDDEKSIKTIHRALDLGINWIDTAAVYGIGHSEEVVGKALKQRNHEEKPYIFTKCGRLQDQQGKIYGSLKADSIRKELEGSLRRLGVDAVDLYQIHWPDPEDEIEEGWETLVRLKEEGKVKHIGVSNFSVEQLKRISKIAPVETLQPPYSLVHPDAEKEILPYCEQQHMGVIVYSPMASGLLSGSITKERLEQMPADDWRKRDPEFQGQRLERNLALQRLLSDLAFPHNVPPGVVAIAWTLRNPAVTGAIVGAREPAQIENLLPAAELRLTDLELEQIDKFLTENP